MPRELQGMEPDDLVPGIPQAALPFPQENALEDSQPEPDVAVVLGTIRDYRDSHPTTALLIVEIADSSLLHDRKRKIPLYARHGIPESWLLNIARRILEVYRDPVGGVYQTRMILREGDTVSPLGRPEAAIAVAELLP